MFSLPFPTSPYLVIEFGNYLLTFLCLRHAWQERRSLTYVIGAATVFGFIVEYSQVSKAHPPYHYTEAVISLPGPVPLGICLSWGIIIYAVLVTTELMNLPRLARALFCGFLAVSIDFVLDPAFVALKFWIWTEPGPWFGVPWVNYVGWFVIVSSFTLTIQQAQKWIPPGSKGALGDFLVAFLSVVPAFLGFVVIMLGYVGLVSLKLAWLPEPLLVFLIFVGSGAVVARGFRHFKRDIEIDPLILAVPGFLYACALFTTFSSGLAVKHESLAVVVPAIVALGMWGYLCRSLNLLCPAESATEGSDP